MSSERTKKIKPEPSFQEYHAQWSGLYEKLNYDKGLAAFFMNRSHDWSEAPFDSSDIFDTVVEVGAGTGIHLKSVRHKLRQYYLTDYSEDSLSKARAAINPTAYDFEIKFQKENAAQLSFPDDFCDRLIATHVLEHLLNPHEVLREWARVVKPGGVLTIVIPTDPGFAWRMGRLVGGRNEFIKAGINYDYWMAREHVNPVNNIVSFINYYFDDVQAGWYPFRVPSMDLNLFYICQVRI